MFLVSLNTLSSTYILIPQAKQPVQRSKFASPYYPLVRAKKATPEQAVEERRKLGLPSTIDKWIIGAMVHTKPSMHDKPGSECRSLEYLLWEDEVEVILNVTRKEVSNSHLLTSLDPMVCQGKIEDPFQDLPVYTLSLRISIPPTSGFLIYFWRSQSVVVSTFTGESEDKTAPDWLQLVTSEIRFWQRRSLMVDMMLYFSELPQNERVSICVKDWCKAISVRSH